ncbi:MAG: Gfo/Idh/MocA family oxidoreductase [Winogradskyella sp.]|uniref:Gfo/Idh/MocA family protein n=1 Tax=Winogradskyella sp. TaxID=1883156 RepID=UPI0017B2AC75|nr:Gfo/Idh/MocA family oxidoreductase [Winogradskyella sp.]MBT8243850.1 Gfo/Idh/MocA family oxidoreductase [Winogradskyella sp.]NNK22255.1 Gfo/Idh/MocA family oxidoreductase [Winogradskyella sp.]
MKTKVVRWGIIGAGNIAEKFAKDLHSVSNCKLYGIASRNLKKAEKFASKFKATKAYGNYESLAKDEQVDVVYIATPHSLHKKHTLLCLNLKTPVLCEKPFAMNLNEVNEMIRTAKTNNLLLMEAMWTAFLPHFQEIKKLVTNQYFGNVIKLEAGFGLHPKYDENSRLFDKSLGGGSLLDIGIYPVFAALSLLGLPNSIKANADFFSNGTDSSCNIIFHYNKAKAFLNSTFLKNTKTKLVIKCERGTIRVNNNFHQPNSVELIYENGQSETKLFNCKTLGYSYEIQHINELLRKGKTESDIMTFNKSIELISTLDQIRNIIGLDYN